MHRMQTYRHLKEMEKSGIVYLTFESPKRFTVISLEELLNLTITELKLRIETMEKEKQALLSEIDNQFSQDTEIDQFAVIQGTHNIRKSILDLRRRAKKEICTSNTLKNLGGYHVHGVHSDVLSGKAKFRYRCLTQVTNNIDAKAGLFLKKVYGSKNTEMRHVDRPINPFPCFAIKDAEEVVVITTPQSHESIDIQQRENISAFWTNNSTIVGLIKNQFENLWKGSTDVKNAIEKKALNNTLEI